MVASSWVGLSFGHETVFSIKAIFFTNLLRFLVIVLRLLICVTFMLYQGENPICKFKPKRV